jgi:F-type H+-transporting ATPase subunit delta
MSEKTTIARPYAKAVFEIAQDQDALDGWSTFLERGRLAVEDARIQGLIGDPAVGRESLAELMIELAGESAGEPGANLLRLLAENGRMAYLPEIAVEFEALKAEALNVLDVEVTSAVALDESQRESLVGSLRKRLGREIRLHTQTDAKLIGGAVIRAGDLVIDGSLLGRLQRLAGVVTH